MPYFEISSGVIHSSVSLFSFWMYRNAHLSEWKNFEDNRNLWLISGSGNGVVAIA